MRLNSEKGVDLQTLIYALGVLLRTGWDRVQPVTCLLIFCELLRKSVLVSGKKKKGSLKSVFSNVKGYLYWVRISHFMSSQ